MQHTPLLSAAALFAFSPLLAADAVVSLTPVVIASIHDEPVDGAGDSFNLHPFQGMIRTQSTRADRAIQEYDVSAFTGQEISMATINGEVWVNNSADNGVRTFDFEIYDANGVPDLTDYQITATVVGSGQYHPPNDSMFGFSFNATAAVQALLSSGATHVGLRVVGTSSPNFPNILSSGAGALDLKIGAPAGAVCAEAIYNCPCFAVSAIGEGCPNSTGVGATILGSGNASVSNSSFSLTSSQLPDTVGIFIQGANLIGGADGNPVGEGRLCIGPEKRYQPQAITGGVVSRSNFDNFATAGTHMNYQFWFRDPVNSCAGAGFNFSPAWTVAWGL